VMRRRPLAPRSMEPPMRSKRIRSNSEKQSAGVMTRPTTSSAPRTPSPPMSQLVKRKFTRSNKRLQRRITILTAPFAPWLNGNMGRTSAPSTLSPWAWAVSLGSPHLQPTVLEVPTRMHLEPATVRETKRHRDWSKLVDFRRWFRRVQRPHLPRLLQSLSKLEASRRSARRCHRRYLRKLRLCRDSLQAFKRRPRRLRRQLRQLLRRNHRDQSLLLLVPRQPARRAWAAVGIQVRRASVPPVRPCRLRARARALRAVRPCIRPLPSLARQRRTPPGRPQAVRPRARHRHSH
jgi:hypothetical protein